MTLSFHIQHYFLPLILANISHMMIVRYGWFKTLEVPLSRALFGDHKTWRGIIFLSLFASMFSLPAAYGSGAIPLNQAGLLGAGLGLSYALAELPNSFIKRKLGIAAGQRSQSFPKLQMLIDKSDSIIGTLIFYSLFIHLEWIEIALVFSMGLGLHLSLSFLIWQIGLKKEF
ncbi:CDP-archaeol synthase [Croceimicrobium sp.]|uniref:CDP-archaeol synthase n=1 Tax=Croceimicrobium sp. TaxID=2828340 RepID=UPI003BA95F9F